MTDHQCAVCGGTDISIRHDGSRPHHWVTPDLCTRCAEDVNPGEVVARVIQHLELVRHQTEAVALALRNRGDKRREAIVRSVGRNLDQAIKRLRCQDAFIAFRASQENNGEGASA